MRRLQVYRFIYWLLFSFFAVGVPSILISTRYEVFKKATKPEIQLAGGAMLIIVLLVFFLRNQMGELIESMEDGTLKSLVKQTIRITPIIILYFALSFAEIQMENFKFIVLWSFISNIIASVFQVVHMNYKYQIEQLRG